MDDSLPAPQPEVPAPGPGPRYWQVAAGSGARDYALQFLRYGLAFVGPHRADVIAQVRPGDRVLLKRGLGALAAVGVAAERGGHCTGSGDKPWLEDFDGWRLGHYCHVDWRVPPEPVPAPGLTRDTLCGVNQPALRALAERLLADLPPGPAPEPEPGPTRPVGDTEITSFLIRRGLRPSAAEDLTGALRRIRGLAEYYYSEQDWRDVREHETRTNLILPLLQALGWPEQRVKIELSTRAGGRVDVACFARPYRRDSAGNPNDHDCLVILESKGFEHGLDRAPAQARGYAGHFPACGCLIVSNGYCYKAYRRSGDGSFPEAPTAYLNLLDPRDAYPLDPKNVRGCLEVLEALMPPN